MRAGATLPPLLLTGPDARLSVNQSECVFSYPGSASAPAALRRLRERRIPLRAVRDVTLSEPGRVLRLSLYAGTDPLLELIGDGTKEFPYPYSIRYLPAQAQTARRLYQALTEAVLREPPAPGYLVAGPGVPCRVRTLDATAEFDGQVIAITWRAGASRERRRSGPRWHIPLAVVTAVELGAGRLSIGLAGEPATGGITPDLRVRLLYHAEAVIFAAAVRAALAKAAGTGSVSAAEGPAGRFAATAGRGGRPAGHVTAALSGHEPGLCEISELSADGETAAQLVGVVLRWAAASGAAVVTWWVADWTRQRDRYRGMGFSLTGERRADGALRLRVILRPSARFWAQEIDQVLGGRRPSSPGWPYVLRGLLASLGTPVVIVAVYAALILLQENRSFLGTAALYIVVFLVLAAFTRPALRAILRARRMRSARTAAGALQADPRQPVVYLRSFTDDAWARKLNRIGALASEEEAITAVFSDVGPVVGLDRRTRNLGAAMSEVPGAGWQTAILWLLAHARVVILRAGTGASLLWELRQAREMLAPEQLFILVPADQDAYREFARRAVGVLPYPLPALGFPPVRRRDLVALLTFSAGWQPAAVSLRPRMPLRLILPLDVRLGLRLRPVLRSLGGVRIRYAAWRSRALFVLAVAVVLAVLLVGIISGYVHAVNELSHIQFPTLPPVPSVPLPSLSGNP